MAVGDLIFVPPVAGSSQARALRHVGVIVAWAGWAMVVLFLALYHLTGYPVTWFDEGQLLHVPKDLVTFGVYADISSDGFRFFGPTVGVGPTVLLPVALAFKLFGIGLLQARLVLAGFLLAAVALFTAVARRQYGLLAAWLATLLLITAPAINLLYLGRQVAGEVPAFAFLMLGVLLWWKSTDGGPRRWALLLGASVAFGLCAVTKNQFALILGPTIVLLWALDHWYYRQLSLKFFAVPLVVMGGMVVAGYGTLLLLSLGTRDPLQSLTLLRNASGGAIFVFSPSRILSSLKFLFGPDIVAYWGLPGLLYGVYLARQRSLAGVQQALLVSFAVVGLAWFAFGSIGWPRYAFPALAVTTIFTARLIEDLLAALTRSGQAPTTSPAEARPVLGWLVGLVVVLFLAYGLQEQFRTVAATADTSPQATAAYLTAHVPPGAVVETWEPELGFLTNLTIHYPSPAWLDLAVRAKWLGSDRPLTGYDPVKEVHPNYIVVGPFGKYSKIYDQTLSTTGAQLIQSIGQYDIYRLP